MVAASRATARAVEELAALAEAPHRHGFFAALRRLECLYADKPRIGRAVRPADEPVRLGQSPSLSFAPSSIAEFRAGGANEPSYVGVYFFGLFGPNGPLPLHLTEYAHARELNFDDPCFRRFADVFHHRLLGLFYRAWADAQPALGYDRPDGRRYDTYVGSLFGIGAPELRGLDTVPDEAKLALAGRFALGSRPAEGLVGILESFFGLDFIVEELFGEWLTLPEEQLFRLGGNDPAAALGAGAVLGGSAYSRQHCFRLVCGPLRFEDFENLLPGNRSLERLRDLVRSYIGDELKWTVKLVLRGDQVPACRLGESGRLGWTTWLGRRPEPGDADDVVIDPFFSAN